MAKKHDARAQRMITAHTQGARDAPAGTVSRGRDYATLAEQRAYKGGYTDPKSDANKRWGDMSTPVTGLLEYLPVTGLQGLLLWALAALAIVVAMVRAWHMLH